MHAVDLLDGEAVHQAVLHHGAAAAAPFLGRLEDHDRRAGKIAGLRQIARGAEQHGGMAVMAAGVHLPGNRRLVGHGRGLLDRQRIHVGAQADHAAPLPLVAADHPHHTGPADPRHHLVAAEALELVGDRRRGPVHVVHELGMRMDIAPPRGDLAVQVRNPVDDRHRINSSETARNGPPHDHKCNGPDWTGQSPPRSWALGADPGPFGPVRGY